MFLLVRSSSFTRDETGDRSSHPCWLEHLDDENWCVVDTDEIESWVSQDLLETCPSVELRLLSDWDDPIVMADVNAVRTLECLPQHFAIL